MKLQRLAESTSTPVSTVKFYLREGLLSPGRKLNATTAAYGQEHVERLELIGALRQVVGLGLADVRRVVEAVETLDPVMMMGRVQTIVLDLPAESEPGAAPRSVSEPQPDAAPHRDAELDAQSCGAAEPDAQLDAQPCGAAEPDAQPCGEAGRLTAQDIIDAMGWRAGAPESISALDRQLATMARWGLTPSLEGALVYARAADQVADHELMSAAPWEETAEPPSKDRIATYTAVGVHAYSQLLLRLHSVAQGSYARGYQRPVC